MNQSLERAAVILTLLDSVSGAEGLGVLEIVRLTGLKAPTVHNFLKTLTVLGWLEWCPRGKYRLSQKYQWLGWDGERKSVLVRAARSPLITLNAAVNETVTLNVCAGGYWQTLLKFERRHELTARYLLPLNRNFYISATGRCILSLLTEEELAEYRRNFRPPLETEWTGAGTPAEMREKLAAIRGNGWELYVHPDYDVVGIGAPLPRIGAPLPAAIGTIVARSRFRGDHRERILAGLRAVVAEIMRNCEALPEAPITPLPGFRRTPPL